ncbi:Chaperone protein dnaJ 6, partial [Tetrabaena socialis]
MSAKVLGVAKDASADEVKKAYRQRALQLHPDKNPSEDAKAKFQMLQKVYAILGDEEKRKVYDQTGSTDDDVLSGAGFDDLVGYFRSLFRVKVEDVDEFTARYHGSAEERSDLLRYYSQFTGRMAEVFRHLMCSEPETDSHRLMDILEEAIAAGDVTRFKPFTAWAKQVASRPRPAPRPRPAAGGGGGGQQNSLVAAIQAKRAAAADAFFDSLAAKYGGGAAGGKPKGKAGGKGAARSKGKGPDAGEDGNRAAVVAKAAEPTDEEFEAAQRRWEGRG